MRSSDWTLVVHNWECVYYVRERNGRWYLRYESASRRGPTGDPKGYATLDAACEAARRYCSY